MNAQLEELPEWLLDKSADDPIPRYPTTKADRELQETTFLALFERVIEGLEGGNTISSTIAAYPRQIDKGRFMSWVRRDPERMKRFDSAKENGMLILEDKLVEIAEGADSTEDVQRSKLRADTLKWIMQSWNRKRYGDKQQIDVTNNIVIDMKAKLEERNKRLSEYKMTVIEGEATRVE